MTLKDIENLTGIVNSEGRPVFVRDTENRLIIALYYNHSDAVDALDSLPKPQDYSLKDFSVEGIEESQVE